MADFDCWKTNVASKLGQNIRFDVQMESGWCSGGGLEDTQHYLLDSNLFDDLRQ